jgi:hypothetical protein
VSSVSVRKLHRLLAGWATRELHCHGPMGVRDLSEVCTSSACLLSFLSQLWEEAHSSFTIYASARQRLRGQPQLSSVALLRADQRQHEEEDVGKKGKICIGRLTCKIMDDMWGSLTLIFYKPRLLKQMAFSFSIAHNSP